MPSAQKTPLARTLPQFARQKVLEQIEQQGRALPCHVVAVRGQIVTVAFDVEAAPQLLPQVTIPLVTGVYDWQPVQVGDKGMTVPADVYLGGVSGLGGGVADLTPRANLTALLFVPIANSSWSAPGGDAGKRVVQGPNGALIQDTSGEAVGLFSKSNGITLSFGGYEIQITSTGITFTGGSRTVTFNSSGFTIDGIAFETHAHQYLPGTGAQTDTSGPVTP